MKKLTNNVYGNIAGINLPFFGVNGRDACPNIMKSDGTPTECPLSPNEEYTYINAFHIERVYPTIPVRVHWALNDGKSDLICFEVQAIIV